MTSNGNSKAAANQAMHTAHAADLVLKPYQSRVPGDRDRYPTEGSMNLSLRLVTVLVFAGCASSKPPQESKSASRQSAPTAKLDQATAALDLPKLSTVRTSEEEKAIAVAKSYFGIGDNPERDADFSVTQTDKGYRVFVGFVMVDQDGKRYSYPGAHCALVISPSGEILEEIKGL